jgi:[ribosomal protein S18]-alanine N-acetyltransferase
VIYRRYQPEDFAQLYAIEMVCFQTPFRFPLRYMRELVGSSNSATWIAEEDLQMCGFAIVEWTEEEGQAIAYIQTIEVTPVQRNRGLASELLRRIETSASAVGAQVLWLHVAEANAAAIHLYLAHGYLHQGREENYYASGIPAFIYAKPLFPAGSSEI